MTHRDRGEAGAPEGPTRDGPDGSSGSRQGTPGLRCELCGGPVLDRHCKVVCLNCGFQRDCSDP